MNAPITSGVSDPAALRNFLDSLEDQRPQSRYTAKLQKWCEDNAGSRAFAAVRNGDAVEISILDVIGYDFWTGGGVTSKAIKRELDANKDAKTVKVLINSPGGDVWEGIAIHSMLNRHAGRVEVEVIGLAASAASVIAMAGEAIAMHEGAMMMIHPAWTIAMGNRSDMQSTADFLSKVDASILDIYKRRTGRNSDDVQKMVEAETWMTAHEAVDEKFATVVIPAKSGESKPKQRAKALAEGVPAPLAKETEPMPNTEPTPPPAAATEPADDLTDEEREIAAEAARKAVADKRASEREAFLNSHPLVRARRAPAPPFGGMHK